MTFDTSHLVGNRHVAGYLKRMLDTGRVGNSLLFAGPSGVGKSLFAHAVAKALVTQNDPEGTHALKVDRHNHPDIRVLLPVGKLGMHNMETIRLFNRDVSEAPYESAWKVFIIHDDDRMLPYSANALLKTFEEPPTTSVIILISSAPEQLLPTVLSRCRRVAFQPVASEEIATLLQKDHNKSREEALVIAAQARGSVGAALHIAKAGPDPRRALLLKMLSQGRFTGFQELKTVVKELTTLVADDKQRCEAEQRQQLSSEVIKNLSAVQREAVEKEIEGAVAMRYQEQVSDLLDIILTWYRDMHLSHLGGDETLLFHPDFHRQTEQALQRGLLLPMAIVDEIVEKTKLSIERSTPLAPSLENLFLSLNML